MRTNKPEGDAPKDERKGKWKLVAAVIYAWSDARNPKQDLKCLKPTRTVKHKEEIEVVK